MPFPWLKRQATAPYAYEQAILNEISMLLDFVAGCPGKTLQDLKVTDTDIAQPGAVMPVCKVLARLTTIDRALNASGHPGLGDGDPSFLLLVRDALNALIKPASGLTVAYTAMVVGNRRGQAVRSRAVLAGQAYSGLRSIAWRHKYGQRMLLTFAVLMTLVATWDSAKVALGKALLHNIQDLRVKQADISREKVRLEETFSLPNAPAINLIQLIGNSSPAPGSARLTVRLCDRPTLVMAALTGASASAPLLKAAPAATITLFESAAQQDVCDRDKALGDSFFLAHQAINAYIEDWPAIAGAGFEILARAGRVVGDMAQALCSRVTQTCNGHPNPLIGLSRDDRHADSELLIAPVLVVLGNYVLPVIFAVLGAAAFVVLDFYGKLRDSMLAPRDHVLSWIRLVLGSVIGACIGLFFSSYGPPAQGSQTDLIGALTLSASSIGFLAGFGVEGVFALLETLVKRVFGGEPARG